MEKKTKEMMKPQIEIESLYLYPDMEQIEAEESPEETLCFATEDGAKAFLYGEQTCGIGFIIKFKAEGETALKQGYGGGVTIRIASEDKQLQKNFTTKFKPMKVWPCGRKNGMFYAGTFMFTEDCTEAEEFFYNYSINGCMGSIEINGLTVMNDDFGVVIDISADFRMKDSHAELGKDDLRIKETAVLPTEELVEKKRG